MLFEDGSIIKRYPILGLAFSICKTTVGIRDRLLYTNVIEFIEEFNKGTISKADLEKHKKNVNDDRKIKKEYEFVLRYIDLCTSKSHAAILARIYRSYVLEEISWDQFCELSEVNGRLFVSDGELLKQIGFLNRLTAVSEDDESRINRLYSLGLIIDKRLHSNTGFLYEFSNGETYNNMDDEENAIVLTKLGKLYCKYLDVSIKDGIEKSIEIKKKH